MHRFCGAAMAFLVTAAAASAQAQRAAGSDTMRVSDTTRLVLVGSPEEDRRRIDEIRGNTPLAGSLIRSPSASLAESNGSRDFSFAGVVIDGRSNTKIPFSLDDGALWAGRGLGARVTAAVRADVGHFHLLFAPEAFHVQNEGFPILPSNLDGRSAYASPFLSGPMSADLPTRFGTDPFTVVDLGQSAAWFSMNHVDVGASTENQWWGPAIQNALVMSNNAAGIPEVFVRTNRPWHTRIGDFEGKLMAGELTESLYFDDNSSDDRRSISGLVVTYTPAGVPDFSVGLARAVYSPAPTTGSVFKNSLGALTRWSASRVDASQVGSNAFDQVGSLFARYVLPASGSEVYAEWSRMLLPASLRDVLVAPEYTQGYTLGLQVTGDVRHGAVVRFQAEVTDLEQQPVSLAADTLSFYTSRAVPQGYTQRGQSIGAAIGPGGSSQLLGLDYLRRRWDVGTFAERIRWDNDAYYLQPTGFGFFSNDVTVLIGLRGTAHVYGSELHLEFSTSQRMNFMFQNLRGGFGVQRQNDFQNNSLRFWLSR